MAARVIQLGALRSDPAPKKSAGYVPTPEELIPEVTDEYAQEEVTAAKVLLLLFTGAVGVWFSLEVCYEGFRNAARNPSHPERDLPPSWIHAWLLHHRLRVSDETCMQSGSRLLNPLLEPIGECAVDSAEYQAANAYSIVVRHTLDEAPLSPRLWLRLLLDALHVAGMFLFAWLSLALVVMGGLVTARTYLKRKLIRAYLGTTWFMLFTGVALALLMRHTELAQASTNGTYAGNEVSGVGAEGFLLHEVGRYARNAEMSLSYLTLILNMQIYAGPGWQSAGLFEKLNMVVLVISVICQSVMFAIMAIKLVTLNPLSHAWTDNVHELALFAVHPVRDACNAWALYWGRLRRSPYDWAWHREFNFSVFLLQGSLKGLSLGFSRGGYVFEGTTSVAFRFLNYVPVMGIWFVIWGWRHLQALYDAAVTEPRYVGAGGSARGSATGPPYGSSTAPSGPY